MTTELNPAPGSDPSVSSTNPPASIPVGHAMAVSDFEEYQIHRDAVQAREDELLPLNKAAIFTVLAAAGIAIVVLSFDGSGDSGQIEEITAYGPPPEGEGGLGPVLTLPKDMVDLQSVVSDEHRRIEVKTRSLTLRDAIEEVFYDLLGKTHGGWENDDGGFGEARFVVDAQVIELEVNIRFTDYNCNGYEF